MKIISWNVNGIRAAWNHGLSLFLDENEADIYCFQETKTGEPVHMVEIEGYYSYWSHSGRKNFSGTLCLSRIKPISARYGIKNCQDNEGRVITLEYPDLYLVNCYVPNSQHSYNRSDFRSTWDKLFYEHIADLKKQKPVIICGDFNVAISDIDIYEQSKWIEINSQGFQSRERENLGKLLQLGFTDTYRHFHADELNKFTWWSNRKYKRKENRGWRLDYFFTDNTIMDKVTAAEILDEVYGSDHCPILLEANLCGEDLEKADKIVSRKSKYRYSDVLFMGQYEFLKANSRSDYTTIWDSIDWEKAEESLKTMQEALAKSAYTNDISLIEKWQKKIVYSLDAKVLAVRQVCETSSSTGIDGISWNTPHEKMSAAMSLTSKGYTAMPTRLLLIKCKNGKERRIQIPTYYDRAMQVLYSYALDPVAESWADRKSFAFRKGRSAFDLNEYIKMGLSGDEAPEWVFKGDVKQCYENISHEWVKKNIPLPMGIIEQFLEAGYVVSGDLFPTETGVGIGATISPIIANMVLDGLQNYIYEKLNNGRRIVYPVEDVDFANGNLIRYADDIIITARDYNSALLFKKWTKEFLQERGLSLSEEKSVVLHISEGFDFMSRHYVKEDGRIYVYPSQSSIDRFKSNIVDTLTNFTGSQQTLIKTINRKIDGWATYHKVSSAEDTFRHLDAFIKASLLDLCKRKHPKWDMSKILTKYWYLDYDDKYYYALPEKKDVRVKLLSDTVMISYRPIKTNVNPYIDFDYFDIRSNKRDIQNITGKYRGIWNRQNGCCYYCGKPILRDSAKDIIEIAGAKNRDSMVYVHQRCMYCSVDYVDTEELPETAQDIIDMLTNINSPQKSISQKYLSLYNFFHRNSNSVIKLNFDKIESIIGSQLGKTAFKHKDFWYRRGLNTISQCWLNNNYHISELDLNKQSVTFQFDITNKKTMNVDIPDRIANNRIPIEAKYELENFYDYLIKKYHL